MSNDSYAKRRVVMPDSDRVKQFNLALNRAETLANQSLATNAQDENALLALTLVYGLRADYAALIERHDLAALRFSEKGTELANKLLAVSPQSYDAYVATGIQKYLVVLRPAPVRWLLRVGGIKEVRAWVLGWGGQIEVLEPAELREMMRSSAAGLAAIYRTPDAEEGTS